LFFGRNEEAGLRCVYHGWKFDTAGNCIEQPFERANGPLKKLAARRSYPIRQLAGLLFAYLGPDPVPVLPRWETMVSRRGKRSIVVLPVHRCNWLQSQENSHDPTHTYFLHARMMRERLKDKLDESSIAYFDRPIEDYDFELCEEPAWTGIRKIRKYGGDRPETEAGHPAVFPNILIVPQGRELVIHWRVPMDDTHTAIFWLEFWPNQDGSLSEQRDEDIPVTHVEHPSRPNGEYELTSFISQDLMAWETQGPVFDRSTELIGMSDRGVVMFRNLLKREIEAVQQGRDPAGVVRDARLDKVISVNVSHGQSRVAQEMQAATAK
jgi:5,5'-dehydrodivanillate O-demethylase